MPLPFPLSPAPVGRPQTAAPADQSLLHEKLLRLACALCMALGLFYCGYFWLAGFGVISLLALPLGLGAVVAAIYARCSGNHRRALDGLSLAVFGFIACSALLQDGINSPALRWMIVPLCISLLAGSIRIAVTLVGLAVVELALLELHGPGSWLPVSLLAPPTFQQPALAVAMSTLCLGLIVGLSARWTRGLQRALQLARERATAAVAAQARFVSHFSHEMRTPLQSLVGATDILRANHLAQSQREQLAAIQSQGVKSVLEMLNAVLDFSKIEAGRMTLSEAAVDLRSLVGEVNEQFAVQAFSKGLELTSSYAPEVPLTVFGDATRIRQVVANLVSNAVKFTSAGGVHTHISAEVSAASSGRSVRRISVEVSDTGVGLAPASLATLFKPFHQAAETVASRHGGTGLGLSISKSLAELMGGRIEVVSAPGAGTTFTFRLPLRAVEEPSGGRGLPMTATVVAIVATGNTGLSRHLESRLAELGVSVVASQEIPDDAGVQEARPHVVLVDSALLRAQPSADDRLERWVEAGTKVVLISPLVGESTTNASTRILQLYKPVSRCALEALLEESPLADSKEADAASGTDGVRSRPVVLLAEDDPVNQLVVASMLTACDLDVVTVADGSAALAVLRRQRVGLVLTDVRMPDMDGVAATRTLRQWERAAGSVRTPVIAMTGQHEAEEAQACLDAGIDEVLLKPFRLDVLRRALDIHLRRSH